VALVYDQARQGPAAHALVIGVGGYDHLRGGVSNRKLPRASRYGNLGQLTSPPRSAWAFAQFLRTSRPEDWAAPLSTVDLLISTAPGDDDPGGGGGPYERATRAAIQDAFDDWWDRCDHQGNVAVFYFCGHGFQATNQVLLASDFGSTGNPWAQAFEFNKTRSAFMANRAATQIFLVDACREITTSNVEVPDPSAPPLREPETRQTEYCEHDLTIQSTSRTQKAYGLEGAISYFTEAVLKAFEGGAARRENGQWWVKSDMFSGRIGKMVKLAGGTEQRPVTTSSSSTRLYRLDGVPKVILELACDPAEATGSADLACRRLGNGPRQQRERREFTAWQVHVPAGLYQLEAVFPDRSYTDASDDISVEPPMCSEVLRVL
jgi:hypothetical protein